MLLGVILTTMLVSVQASPVLVYTPQFPYPTQVVFQCPPGGGVFPHGEECAKYYVCTQEGEVGYKANSVLSELGNY